MSEEDSNHHIGMALDDVIKSHKKNESCYKCGKIGHFAASCTVGQMFAGNNSMTCYNCQGFGHRAAQCPSFQQNNGAATLCYSCGHPGHVAIHCPYGGGGGGYSGRMPRPRPGPRMVSAPYARSAPQFVPYASNGQPSVPKPLGTRVYVGSLAYATSWQSLKDHFRCCGNVLHADVMLDPMGRSKGCGIVEFSSHAEAQYAVENMQESELDGRKIWIREDREEKAMGGMGGGVMNGYGKMNHGRLVLPCGNGAPSMGVHRVFVGNLPFSSTWMELKDIFRTFGNIKRTDILQTIDGKSRGCGVVEFDNRRDMMNAISKMNGASLDGRVLEVREDRYAAAF